MRLFHHQSYDPSHPLVRLDPRVKLVCAAGLLVMALTSRGVGFPLVMAGLCAALAFWREIPPRVLALRFAQPLVVALLVVLLKMFMTGHEPLFSLHLLCVDLTGYGDGLREGTGIACRIVGAVSVATMVTMTTPFTEVLAALAWFRAPQGLVEVAFFAWRYLFVLCEDAAIVYNAQKNRLGYSGCRRGMRSLGTLAGSLIIKAFDNSQTMTLAMMQRGYDGRMPLLGQKPLPVGDVASSFLFLVVMGVVWRL